MLAASSILGAEGLDAVRKGSRKTDRPGRAEGGVFIRDLFPFFQPGALGTAYTEARRCSRSGAAR